MGGPWRGVPVYQERQGEPVFACSDTEWLPVDVAELQGSEKTLAPSTPQAGPLLVRSKIGA
jgi:hypothetical protein